MSRFFPLSLAVLGLGLASPLAAQARSAVDGAELDAAVAAPGAGTREAVRQFLAAPETRAVAERMGVSTKDLTARVAALDGASLEQVARQARLAEPALAGGDRVLIISTTTIIIALLILILVTQ